MSEPLNSDRESHQPPHPDPARRRPKGAARYAWLAAGWVCFGVGAVGVVIPGLPTTGPMLLAVACFARGSERLHRWLLDHRLFGPPIRRWQEERIIPLRAKVTAVSMMIASTIYVVFFSPVPRWGVIATVVLVVIGLVVVLRLPHKRPAQSPEGQARSQAAPQAASNENGNEEAQR